MFQLIDTIGAAVLTFFQSISEALKFTLICLAHMLHPKSYNPAMFMVLIKQIYFTTIGIIPLFVLMAALFGSIIIGVVITLTTQYHLEGNIGPILITFVMDEFAPFFTALLISLRSSAAVNTEIAVMSVNHELDTLKAYKINLIDYLFIPRIISGVISVTTLSLLFALIMLSSGYAFVLWYIDMNLSDYIHLLITAISFKDFEVLLLKTIAFGFVTMLIPIYSGLKAQKSYTSIPIAVLNGMVKLFIALFFIEVVSLLIQFI